MKSSLKTASEFPETHSCAVVVCTRDRPLQLDQCLAALAKLRYQKYTVGVVDNGSDNKRTEEIVRRWGANYSFEPRPGLSRARNRGARESNADIVAFLDDDSLCEPEWLSSLVLEFADPSVMAVTGMVMLTTADGNASCVRQDVDERRVVDCQTPSWFEMANFGGIGNGGNMAFRRCAFDIWPGFDDRLGRGALMWGSEEHYAFFSLIDRGYRVVYTPYAVVRHPYPYTVEDLRAEYLKGYSALAAYLTMLLIEQPRHRWTTLRYILYGVKGVQRTWRYSDAKPLLPPPCLSSSWQRIIAYLSGPLLYARACLQHSLTGRGKTSITALSRQLLSHGQQERS
jgi:glycosyltransferase involved in cell wall biosynthesis